MDSKNKGNLINKEKKRQESDLSIVNRLPKTLKHHTLSFLAGNCIESRTINSLYFSPFLKESLFSKDKFLLSAAHRAAHNLAYRVDVEKTLTFMQRNFNIFQSFPVPIQIIDPHGRSVKRTSIMGILVALDEFDVVTATSKTKPYDLISTIFSWFAKTNNPKSRRVKNLLQLQLAENFNLFHIDASKKRREYYLQKIDLFINKVIHCTDISNRDDKISFKSQLNLEFVQDFINNAFNPIPNDNGELGVIWDYWQLYLDYIELLKTYVNKNNRSDKPRRNLGGLFTRKTDIVDVAVYMAFLRSSQFCHLEVLARGIGNVSAKILPTRFDCTNDCPSILKGIGLSHFFSFHGYRRRYHLLPGTLRRISSEQVIRKFLSNKNRHITQLMQSQAQGKRHCLML